MLIAADEKGGRLHAIEKAGERTYSLCTLRTWVKEDDLVTRAGIVEDRGDKPAKRLATRHKTGVSQPWWASCAAEPVEIPLNGNEPPKSSKLAMLVPEDETDNLSSNPIVPNPAPPADDATPLPGQADMKPEDGITTLPSQDVLQELAKRYLETLYVSKASLAFFAKGPLARARASLASEQASTERLGEMIDFLKEAVMSVSVMEKKYRDAAPAFIKDLPLRPESESEKPKAKKKRKWKSKRDKPGMLHGEKEYIETWWRADEGALPMMSNPEDRNSAIRRRIPQIRSRETYLQIILILEVFALESLATSKSALMTKETSQKDQEPDNECKTKAKKPVDYATILDSQLDKLCIWQSLEAISPLKQSKDGSAQDENNQDELKRFCIEVILPFYMSRVPKHAASVNMKLGGPAPAKQSASTSRRPGEPATRKPPEKKPRKSLHRTATETLAPSLRTASSLQRSATDTQTMEPIKRESSEVALDSVPAAKPRPGPRQRPSVLSTLSANRREVDLSAKSQANARRAKQKAEAEQKKEEAIAALRKPNRSLATRETAETADKSFARATARPKPAPAPRKRASEVVTATPTRSRALPPSFHNSNIDPSTSTVSASTFPNHHIEVPGSIIPQSTRRPQHQRYSIEETPSRGFAKYMPLSLARAPGTLELSPAAQRKHSNIAIMATPSKPVKTFTALPQTPSRSPKDGALALTPLRQMPAGVAEEERERGGGREDQGESTTLYAALGWDEEYEELA